MSKISTFVLALSILSAVACAEASDCPMDIHPLEIKNKLINYQKFSSNKGEHLVRFENGDLLIARYNAECQLGFDIAFFSQEGLNNVEQRITTAAWLVSLFKSYDSINQLISKSLKENSLLKKSSFNLSIPGEYGDEEHFISLKDIVVSEDFDTLMFRSLMTYSWLPPSGE